jgi:hypothetical protein
MTFSTSALASTFSQSVVNYGLELLAVFALWNSYRCTNCSTRGYIAKAKADQVARFYYLFNLRYRLNALSKRGKL